MIAHAKGRYIRVSSVKMRIVLDLIRGKKVTEALAILAYTDKGVTRSVSKVLSSAISNAKVKGVPEDQLFISKIQANQGPSWKRFRAAAFGRATSILKRTAHLTIELDVIKK